MEQQVRIANLLQEYKTAFGGGSPRLFSAPGRVELCGNHTDHQGGQVVALAIDLDILGAACPREDAIVRLYSKGVDPCEVDLNGECPKQGTSDALIWGVAKWLKNNGYGVGGFDCVTHSNIPFGSGLSSSAAFENFVATVFEGLHNTESIDPVHKALAGQWAENTCFGKPCGLMDQLASCLGNVSFMEFADAQNPKTQTVDMPLDAIDRVLCVVKTGGSHADLTHHYAAIPAEMKGVAAYFGKEVLSQITKEQVIDNLPALRKTVGDRGVLRALNYFDECERSRRVLSALTDGRVAEVLPILSDSGYGSQTLLQNVSNPEDTAFDGGGFGGTMLGIVPKEDFARYKTQMETVFGEDSCILLQVRPYGGIELN